MSESFKPRYNREQAEALEEETWAAIREAYDKDDAVWKYSKDGVVDNVHDYKLGSGGDTFEDAIVNLAEKVRLEYGYDRSKIITPPNKPN
jgi:hypothetical protein